MPDCAWLHRSSSGGDGGGEQGDSPDIRNSSTVRIDHDAPDDIVAHNGDYSEVGFPVCLCVDGFRDFGRDRTSGGATAAARSLNRRSVSNGDSAGADSVSDSGESGDGGFSDGPCGHGAWRRRIGVVILDTTAMKKSRGISLGTKKLNLTE